MIDTALAIVHLPRPTAQSSEAEAALIYGALPQDLPAAHLRAVCSEKTGIRKFGDRLAIALPQGEWGWLVWLLDGVPPVTELARQVEQINQLSKGLLLAGKGQSSTAANTPVAPGPQSGVTQALLNRLAQAQKRTPSRALQLLADLTVEHGLCDAAAVAELRHGKLHKLHLSDQNLAKYADELRLVMASGLSNTPVARRVERSDFSEDALDLGLLGDMTNDMAKTDAIYLDLPARSAQGTAFLLFGPNADPAPECASLRDVMTLVAGRTAPLSQRRKIIRRAVATALAALAIWLALPTTQRVTATALSQPSDGRAVALPVGAFLEHIDIRVGDRVNAGDQLARFRAPDLEEERASLRLQIAVEEVSAQSALSGNDYGAYLLSQQKIASARENLTRIEARIDGLTITAPTPGRVVSAMGPEITGQYVQLGETVAILQPQDQFSVALTVSRVDAPLLAPGQPGEVWFRGIAGQLWPLQTLTPVSQQQNPNTGEDSLTLRARIDPQSDQAALVTGLSGFAKIDTGRAMRIKVLSRYAVEYVRTKAWTWFDLRF